MSKYINETKCTSCEDGMMKWHLFEAKESPTGEDILLGACDCGKCDEKLPE